MKKKLTLIVISCLFCAAVFAQDAAYTNELIIKYKALAYPINAYNKNGETNSRICLTPLLTEAKKNWSKLTISGQTFFKMLYTRPQIGNELTAQTQHFVFHYSKTDSNAVSLTDANMNSIPDYIESMSNIFEYVYSQDSTNGYTMPPGDGTIGGNNLYDIYIQKLGTRLYGSVAPESMINDNPNSKTVTETTAYTSYMNMNNTYDWTKNSDTAMKVTAAHEFFHAVQMGMTLADNQTNFVSEGTAVWMEEQIYPGFDDNLQYLSGTFSTPDIALNINRNYDKNTYDDHWYASWIYFQYLSERISKNPVIVRNIFETLIDSSLNDIQGIDNALKKYNSDFEASFKNFTIANLLLIKDPAFAPYYYNRADVYAIKTNGAFIEGALNFLGNDVVWDSKINGNGRLQRNSADYLRISTTQNFGLTFSLAANPNTVVKTVLVKRNITKNTFEIVEPVINGFTQTFNCTDAANWERFDIVITRLEKFSKDSTSLQYQLTAHQAVLTDIASIVDNPIKIYPNPVQDDFTVETPRLANMELLLTDLSGKNAMNIRSSNGFNQFHINTSGLENGLYFLKIKVDEKIVDVQKIVVSR